MSKATLSLWHCLSVVLISLGSHVVQAQQVVEASVTAAGQSSAASGSTAELYFKLQQLEQEVMTLRGQLEEQDHLIRRLQNQRLSDYKDLDGRISALRGSGRPPAGAIGIGSYTGGAQPSAAAPAVPASEASTADIESTPVSPPISTAAVDSGETVANSGGEKQAYDAAQALVKSQRFDEALKAFRGFTAEYPRGQYIANAHYWLGVLYTYEAQTDNAIKEFNTVVQSYATHRKAPDALFKLAKAHHLRGDETTAKILLNRVITDYADSGDRAVQLAKDYLETEFGG